MTSNFDRRRINGPEESFSPVFDDESDTERNQWSVGKPRPGRLSGDIRPICAPFICFACTSLTPLMVAVLQPGLISQANGSAYIETERTKIACAVFVPSLVVLRC
jgi:exosome complex component MTR3